MIRTIGVVADDTTGANDIGIMFRNSGYSAKVVTFEENTVLNIDTNVVIVDTDSRLDSKELSYNKVFEATKQLKRAGCSTFHNKTCSVFRGNIGVEFDAMLDALEEDFAVISLAFPKNGRETVNGNHTVYGQALEDSAFANDPVHPMNESNLVSILSKQTSRKVTFIHLDVVRKGHEALRKEIIKAKEAFNYCIVDAQTQEDIAITAKAIHDFPVIGGSSAIGEELPAFYQSEPIETPINKIRLNESQGVLVVSGSLTPQTKSQTAFLKSTGIRSITVDSRSIFNDEYQSEVKTVIEEAVRIITSGEDLLIMADDRQEVVNETKILGKEKGLNPLETSKKVSAALAEVTKQVALRTNLKRLVIAGGDTSGTVSRELGIKGNYVLAEVETGVPSGFALGKDMYIILKSGSFGKEKFLEKAIVHLKELTQ